MFLLNAFSINMLPAGVSTVTFADKTVEEARELAAQAGVKSAVGHAATAAVFADVLGVDVPLNRVSVAIPPRLYGCPPWVALVGQYSGPRLEEGATALPEGAAIRWVTVYVD